MSLHRCPRCQMPFTFVGKLIRCFICKVRLVNWKSCETHVMVASCVSTIVTLIMEWK